MGDPGNGPNLAGEVTVLYGGTDGRIARGTADRLSQGMPGVGGASESGDAFGQVLTTAHLDADGCLDLVVGAPQETIGSAASAGAAYVVFGSPAGLGRGRAGRVRARAGRRPGRGGGLRALRVGPPRRPVAGQHQRGGAAESAMLASAPQPVDPTPGMTILPLDGGTARTLANTDLPAWVGGIGLAVAGRPSATAVDPSASISTND